MSRRVACKIAFIVAVTCLVASGLPCFSQTRKRSKKLWVASVVSLAAANALDARFSMGRYESNPLLRDASGRFQSGRGVLIKSAASGGSLLLQALLFRTKREEDLYKPAAIVNFTCAGVLGGVAFSNSRVPKTAAPDYLRAP